MRSGNAPFGSRTSRTCRGRRDLKYVCHVFVPQTARPWRRPILRAYTRIFYGKTFYKTAYNTCASLVCSVITFLSIHVRVVTRNQSCVVRNNRVCHACIKNVHFSRNIISSPTRVYKRKRRDRGTYECEIEWFSGSRRDIGKMRTDRG